MSKEKKIGPSKWTLEEAIHLLQTHFEPKAKEIGYHTALTGGVLYRGHSEKDLDLIVYPRKTDYQRSPREILGALGIDRAPLTERAKASGAARDDEKTVHLCTFRGKRIDVFFLS